MVDYARDDSLVSLLEEQLQTVWNAKILIAACAITAGLAGYFGAQLLPKIYEASVIVRPQSSAQFVGLGSLLAGTSGDWHRPENIATSGYELFLRNIRNKFAREAALLSRRTLFPGTNFDDRYDVLALSNNISVTATDKPVVDRAARITFRYGSGQQGADFLNSYVDQIISETASEMVGDGISTLKAMRADRQRELDRLRQQQNVALQQTVAKYDDALATAAAAGIESPIISNLGSTAAIVAGNSQVPLYYYGVTILKSEKKNLQSHIGDDLSIPEFSSIQAALKDLDGRLEALSQVKIKPVNISENAYQSDRPTWPPAMNFAIGFLLAGAVFGYLWALLRARHHQAA